MSTSSVTSSQERVLSDPETLIKLQLAAPSRIDVLRKITLCAGAIQPEKHGQLVATVLRLPWCEHDGLAAAVLDFVLALVGASPGFVGPCVDALVRTFRLPEKPTDGTPVLESVVQRVHETLKGVLRVCPLGVRCAARRPALRATLRSARRGAASAALPHARPRARPPDAALPPPPPPPTPLSLPRPRSNLYGAIKEHFPHRRLDLRVHVHFMRQLLDVLRHCLQIRARALHLLVERLVELDVQIAVQIRKLEEAADDDDTVFEARPPLSFDPPARRAPPTPPPISPHPAPRRTRARAPPSPRRWTWRTRARTS